MQKGFTLLELLIAMAVFAIMATMAYAGLKTVIDTQQATSSRAVQIRQLQQTLQLMNEDFLQVTPRTVRDELGDAEPALRSGTGETLLSLTRVKPELLTSGEHNRLQRIGYQFERGTLYRLVWNTLDRTQQSQPKRKKLLEAESVEIRFLDSEWVSGWPLAGGAIPRAIEVIFKLNGFGQVRRGFWLQ